MMLIAQIAADPDAISYGWLFTKMISAMVVIIVLALVTLKYLLPKMVKFKQRSNSRIQVLDFQPLDQRRVIYLVEIDDKKVAMAVSDHGVAKLCEWDQPES